MLLLAEPPFAMVPRKQQKSGPAPMWAHPAASEPRVKPAGQVSLKDTFWASEGPALLLTDRKSVVLVKWAAVGWGSRSVLLIDRSEMVLNMVEVVMVLLRR